MLKLSERANAIVTLSKDLADSVAEYEKCKEQTGYSPYQGTAYDHDPCKYLSTHDSRGAMRNRIKTIRAELMKLSEEL